MDFKDQLRNYQEFINKELEKKSKKARMSRIYIK